MCVGKNHEAKRAVQVGVLIRMHRHLRASLYSIFVCACRTARAYGGTREDYQADRRVDPDA
jgi:hypothetical protein